MARPKPSSEAEQLYKADAALAGRRAELLDAARETETQFRAAQARHAPDVEVRRLANPDMMIEIEADAVVSGNDAFPNWCGPSSQP